MTETREAAVDEAAGVGGHLRRGRQRDARASRSQVDGVTAEVAGDALVGSRFHGGEDNALGRGAAL